MSSLPLLPLLPLALLVLAAPLHAQQGGQVALRPIAFAVRDTAHPRPPLTGRIVTSQAVGGLLGGFIGAGVAFVPLALRGFGGEPASDDAIIGALLVGYTAGTVLGVHAVGRAHGMKSRWWATTLGALGGVIGGPVVLFTMPVGATLGYNWKREENR